MTKIIQWIKELMQSLFPKCPNCGGALEAERYDSVGNFTVYTCKECGKVLY